MDVTVVGSGPNGLAAAVIMARAGMKVTVFEAMDTPGGGCRTAETTLPGFRHDICSAVHPMAFASRFFQQFELEKRMDFVVPDVSYAHGITPGRVGVAHRDLEATAAGLGRDGAAWKAFYQPLLDEMDFVNTATGSSLLRWPDNPVQLAKFGARVLELGTTAALRRFQGETAPAMLAGLSAHGMGRLPSAVRPNLAMAGIGLVLGAHAHHRGWPVPVGGSQAIVAALVKDLRAHGGDVVTSSPVARLEDLPPAAATFFNTSAWDFARIAGDRLPAGYRRAVSRFRPGGGVAKVDFALSGPVPWKDADLERTATIHLGGTWRDIARAEKAVSAGAVPENPYLLLTQPSLFDPSRAPAGHHTLWAYTHVPAGSGWNPTEKITAMVEDYAPGFRDLVLASTTMTAPDFQAHNPNYLGGDISSGAVTMTQMVKRPVARPRPWRTPIQGFYLCSSSTPPGPAVHGLCGLHAAETALEDLFGLPLPDLSHSPTPRSVHA